MRHIRFYRSEQAATQAETTLATQAGIEQVFIYQAREDDMWFASDEDTGSFIRFKQYNKLWSGLYWKTLTFEPPAPRIYETTTQMYSTEQRLLQARLAPQLLTACHSHIYTFHIHGIRMLCVVDQYRGQCMPIDTEDGIVVAEYYATYGQTKLPGPMS